MSFFLIALFLVKPTVILYNLLVKAKQKKVFVHLSFVMEGQNQDAFYTDMTCVCTYCMDLFEKIKKMNNKPFYF